MRIRNPVLLSEQFYATLTFLRYGFLACTELFLEIFTAMTELRALDRTGTIREHVKKNTKRRFFL
jgi:hypothetical protein